MLSEEQKLNRIKGIGASETATVMGLNPYMSAYELFLIKTGKKEAPDLSNVAQVYWGNMHEESIIKHYEKINSCTVKRNLDTFYHKDHKFMLCHLDGLVEKSNKILECKFAMFARDEWGESGTDVVPINYILQVQHQLAVTGFEEADLAVLIGGWDFRVYHFKRDEQLISKILQELSEFWNKVENNIAPDLRDRADVALAYPYCNNNMKEANQDVYDVLQRLTLLKNDEKEIEKKKSKLEKELTLYIQDSEGVKIDNCVLATWKPNKNGNRVLRIWGMK